MLHANKMLRLKLVSLSRLSLSLGFVFMLFVGSINGMSPNAVHHKSLNQFFVLDNTIKAGIDDPYMMPYYTGKILPTPQKVEYKNEYLSLAQTAIILNHVGQNDLRLKYLLERITRYGGNYEFVTEANSKHTCVIKINDDALNTPLNAQGYVIKSNGKTLSLKGSDFQGLLWAISSLNQMVFIKHGETVIRLLDVTDWPESLRRGFLAEHEISKNPVVLAHFMVAFKLNLVDFRGELAGDRKRYNNWRLPRSDIFLERVKEIGERLSPLDFQWYAGARFLGYDQVPQINCGGKADFDIIYNNFALPVAKAGGNLSVQFDDTRYPMHLDDKKKFKTAAKADYYLLTKLYKKLKKDYPDIRMAFCPPVYWGPIAPNPLPESRDEYLNMIGALPRAIDIYWTGPSVRSEKVLQEHVKWEVDRIKRKPMVFQNGVGNPHVFSYHYVTDPIYNLNKWYYKGYLKDVKAYMLNGGDIDKSGVLVSIVDWTWNPDKFDAEATIKDAIMKLTGSEAYPILKEINAELSKFDPYLPDVTMKAVANSALLYEALDNLEMLTEKLNKLNGKSIEFWTAVYGSHISRVQHFVKQVHQASKDPLVKKIVGKKNASVTMYHAIKDVDFNPDTDLLIEPEKFIGGGVITYGYYNAKAGIHLEDRPTAYICGAKTSISTMSANFKLNQLQLADYQLIISGADDFQKEKCPIRITLNDNVIFEGPTTFLNKKWNVKKFKLSAKMLKRNNILTISNISPTGNYDAPPAFLLNYVVLRGLKK